MRLTKTDFLIAKDCNKNSWLKVHRPDIYKVKPLTDFDKNIIETGNEIDELARELFPDGSLVEHRDDIGLTNKLLAEHTPVIYQPVFAMVLQHSLLRTIILRATVPHQRKTMRSPQDFRRWER